MMQPILSIRDLTIGFRRYGKWCDVTQNVGVDVMPGETVAIVGESGSGKSVTALATMRLLNSEQCRVRGTIRFDGLDLLRQSERQMRQIRGREIGMIFQEPMTSLNPVLTVGQQLNEVIKRHSDLRGRSSYKAAIELLEKVRIPAAASRMDDYPHNFSGGMRQRVMIAMALAGAPKLLIADEPTTALDVTVQSQIIDLIKLLQKQDGLSVLFITHDMGVVAEIADNIVVMCQGSVVEKGATKQIFSEQKQKYTRALLNSVPVLGSMNGLPGPVKFPPIDSSTGLVAASASDSDPLPVKSQVVLEVKNLSKRYPIKAGPFGRIKGRLHAIENVSFSLRAGETLAIVGESGSGKSTIARSVLRLVEPDAGKIFLLGEDISHLDRNTMRSRRSSIQMVFQDPFASLNPKMKIGELVAEPLYAFRPLEKEKVKRKVGELLERVGLSRDVTDRYPHEFSGGQRQRICIARALALEPRIIVADECVSALDVTIKTQVINLLLDLQQQQGLSYLFISHDMAVVERVSHRVAVMYLGEIVEIGSRQQIFRNPQHAYTKRLLSAVPIPDPNRRRPKIQTAQGDAQNTMRPLSYIPKEPHYIEVENGHIYRIN